MSKQLKIMEQLTFLLLCSAEKTTAHGFKKKKKTYDRILDQQTSHDTQKLLSGPKTRNMSSRLHLAKRFSKLNTIPSPGTPFFLSLYTFHSITSLSRSLSFLILCSSSAPLWRCVILVLSYICLRTAEGPCMTRERSFSLTGLWDLSYAGSGMTSSRFFLLNVG